MSSDPQAHLRNVIRRGRPLNFGGVTERSARAAVAVATRFYSGDGGTQRRIGRPPLETPVAASWGLVAQLCGYRTEARCRQQALRVMLAAETPNYVTSVRDPRDLSETTHWGADIHFAQGPFWWQIEVSDGESSPFVHVVTSCWKYHPIPLELQQKEKND